MYKKTNNTQKRRKTNNYKKRTTNKKYNKPNKNKDDKIVRNYDVVNTKYITVSTIKFKSNIFKHKFKITTNDRNIILNKLGLKILDKSDKLGLKVLDNSEMIRFSKYYNPNEQEILCGIFNELFDNIEEYVNKITSKILYNHNQTICGYHVINLPNKFQPSRYIVQLPFNFSVSKFEKRINVSLNLHECLKIICSCLKLTNVFKDSYNISSQYDKIYDSMIDKLNVSPSINGFIYEDNKFSYGFFINNKDDKREIMKRSKIILSSTINTGYVLPSEIIKFIASVSKSLTRVKRVSFDKK